jgi:DNA repair protein RadC
MEQLVFGNMPKSEPTLRVLHETPAARVLSAGAQAASNLELLAVVLRDPDTALRLLAEYPALRDLFNAPEIELQTIKGVGPGSAAIVKAALELGRRLTTETDQDRPQIRCPADAASLLMAQMSHLEQEELRVMLLDTRNRVIDIVPIYRGSVNTSMVRIAEVLRPAIRANCPAMIVAHNHPSSDVSPSPEDVAVTKELIQAGQLLDVEILDHIVVGRQKYASLKELKLAFE